MHEWLCNKRTSYTENTQHANHLSPLDGDDDLLHLALVQYVFKEVEHEVIAAPHGGSKHDDKYMRTMPSVMAKLKKEPVGQKPDSCINLMQSPRHGIVHCHSQANATGNVTFKHFISARPGLNFELLG